MLSCDLEKFVGYSDEVDPIPDSALIYGVISNKFTGETVQKAQIAFDYQGADDITRVRGSFFYAEPGIPMWAVNIKPELARVPIDSPYTAYYQIKVPADIGIYTLVRYYVISAWDSAAHKDSTSNTIAGVDTFLFDPALAVGE